MQNQSPIFLVLLIILFFGTQCSTSKNVTKPKDTKSIQQPVAEREFRAAWIASVANINWPSKPGLPVEEQKEEAIKLLDFLADNNFNAAILQVRPQCDALYPSELEPWSYYLTGTQGEAPKPFYDPLQFWIEEAHKRAIELHAWLNPYRAHHVVGGPISDQSIVKTKPGLVVKLETGYYWMEPTARETQDHSYDVVMDIVKRYDVDGIHFDDYFYPYPSYNNGKDFPDEKSWINYQKQEGKLDRADWRRDAVNSFMKRVYEGIKANKKHVKFGLSPFGIWRPNNPPSIKGFDQYEQLYADAKLWLNEGWIDYWTPQLYWPINQIPQSFPVLLGWWDQQNYKGRHFWPGISLGRKSGQEKVDEVINQIMISRGVLYESPGVVHWNIDGFTNSELLTKAVVEGPYRKKALVPASPWLDNEAPNAPTVRVAIENDSLKLNWNPNKPEELSAYVVYKKYGEAWTYDIVGRNVQSEKLSGYEYKKAIADIENTEEIKSINEVLSPLNTIAVTAVDKYGNESAFSQVNVSDKTWELIPELGVFLEQFQKEEEVASAGAVQAIILETDTWFGGNEVGLSKQMNQIGGAGYNTVLVRLSGEREELAQLIDAAHSENLNLLAIIDNENTNVNQLVANYDLDGFMFDLDDYSSLENKVVDMLLVKPYLINGIYTSDDRNRQQAESLLARGIVDLLVADVNEYKPGETPVKIKVPTQFPEELKKVKPTQVVALDLSAFFPEEATSQAIYINGLEHKIKPDDDGWHKFIATEVDTFLLGINGEIFALPTRQWALPYKYIVKSDRTVKRPEPWVEFRNRPAKYTNRERYDLLGKTDTLNKGFVNGEEAKVYKTGVFFNTVQLNEGKNRVRASALTDAEEEVFYEQEIFYEPAEKRSPFPLWIEEKTLSPEVNMELTEEDVVHVKFNGSKGQNAIVEVFPGGFQFSCIRTDHDDYSTYQAELPLKSFVKNRALKLIVRLNDSFIYPLENSIIVKNADDFPYVKTSEDHVRLTYNQGPIRLGGPVRSEYQKGIILKTNGKIGEHYRIRLNEIETGMMAANQLEELPAEFTQAPYFITNLFCASDGDADVLSIPYLNPVPYEVIPEPDQERIVVRLFGVKTSSTWITHRTGRKVIDKVTWQQTAPETYEVYINLKTSKIWGYEVKPDGKKLSVKLKHPPIIKGEKEKPLAGLRIAIEAGHGGTNTGARGLSGLLEKDVNLALALQLEEICESGGAEVVQVRSSDIDMSLLEKRDTALQSNADLLICIHANSAGGGFLRVSGTSTYYHNAFWAPLAEKIYERLLETDLKEFGLVGSFNYTVIRTTDLPAILVEQAFMSHAEDEEKLADPEFRRQMATKIYDGIVDYLEYMSE